MTHGVGTQHVRHNRARFATAPEGRGESDRRSAPSLRPRAQAAFELLLRSLRKAGRTDVLEMVGGLDRVDDVLRERPASVPTLLELAWQLRDVAEFSPYFQRADGHSTVTDRDQPIAPCNRSYDQVVRAHLHGAARLLFERRERAWAERRARAAREQRRQRKGQGGGLQSRLMAPLKTMLDGEGDLDPDEFRAEYPGYGLFSVLKPSLREPWQFAVLETYARLGTPQARAFGHLLSRVRSAEMLDTLVNLSVDDVGLIRTVCRTFIEVRQNIKLDKAPRWQLSTEAREANDAAEKQISAHEDAVFETVVLKHTAALPLIRELGINIAPDVVRRLTPVFGDEVWDLLTHPDDLENARAMPDHLLPVLGPVSRHVPPDISIMLSQIKDRALAKDLMAFAREAFPDDELARYLSDTARRPIWNALPSKFNNAFRYQRDAQSGGSLRNSDDLRVVSTGIFQSLRLGKLETF